MDADKIAQMVEMMKQLGPAQVRVIQYELNGGHRCDASTNLITCCGVERCQACHIPHLRSVHNKAMIYAYEKFSSARTLTWEGREYKQPVKPKINKPTRKSVPAPKVVKTAKDIADSIPDDQLADIMAMMEAIRKNT